ncbi:MAG: Crp/Fnr family transcriptional regulator [Pseudolabrys sp.]
MTEFGPRATTGGVEEPFDYRAFMARCPNASLMTFQDGEAIHSQADPAATVYYMIEGTVKVTIIAKPGKEAVVAFLRSGSFFGKDCLYGYRQRVATITAMRFCRAVRFPQEAVQQALRRDPAFAKALLTYTLNENALLRQELIDQMLSSSEKRLARILLALADVGADKPSSNIAIPVTQETLANMVGTTRARINRFMIKFRKLGYVEYNGTIRVHRSLENIALSGQPPEATP